MTRQFSIAVPAGLSSPFIRLRKPHEYRYGGKPRNYLGLTPGAQLGKSSPISLSVGSRWEEPIYGVTFEITAVEPGRVTLEVDAIHATITEVSYANGVIELVIN
ncbi:MAG: hypothetical protein WC730_00450 [Patescibacteria group bacterium]|jgi:hypothetical protein